MTNCLPCGRAGRDATVVGLCLHCGAMLCETHLTRERSGPGGMTRFACAHLEPSER